MKINKTVYQELNRLRQNSGAMRDIGKDEHLKFEKGIKVYEEQDKVFKKFQFYKNFVNAIKKEI